MLHHISEAVGFLAQHLENLRPLHRALANITPAILVHILALGRNVLHMC